MFVNSFSRGKLILPGDPLFNETLLTPRPDWQDIAASDGDNYAFVVNPETGLARPVTMAELNDYLEGGDYDERVAQLESAKDDYELE